MIFCSVIKVSPEFVELENDETGETYEVSVSQLPEMQFEMGQIFKCNLEENVYQFDGEETRIRKERVASLLAQLHEA